MNQHGELVRTLASVTFDKCLDLPPSWATDANEIAYEVSNTFAVGTRHHNINQVDVHGVVALAWRFDTGAGGCGGGTDNPAEGLYWQETGPADIARTLQWSIRHHLAIYDGGCAPLQMTDTRTGVTHALSRMWEATQSPAPSGRLAAMMLGASSSHIVLTDHHGAASTTIAPGELPLWSATGRYLYFVQRTAGIVLHLLDPDGNKADFPTYTSAIWRANADGSHLMQIIAQNAYAFGSLHLTPDGHDLIFSQIDNDWNLWRHRLANGSYTYELLHLYGPHLRVQLLDLTTGRLVTIAHDAGRPAIQP